MTEARVFRRKVAHMYPLQLPLEKIKKRTVQKEPEKELTEQKQKKIQKRILKTQWCPGLLNPLTPCASCFLLLACLVAMLRALTNVCASWMTFTVGFTYSFLPALPRAPWGERFRSVQWPAAMKQCPLGERMLRSFTSKSSHCRRCVAGKLL